MYQHKLVKILDGLTKVAYHRLCNKHPPRPNTTICHHTLITSTNYLVNINRNIH